MKKEKKTKKTPEKDNEMQIKKHDIKKKIVVKKEEKIKKRKEKKK